MERPFPAYKGDDPYIFVSYSHKDASAVFPELSRLREQGFKLWFDEGIEAGTEWREEIAQAIRSARLFLYYVTPQSVHSENCRKEVNFAVEEGVPIIAIHTELVELPAGLKLTLSDLQAILKHELPNREYREKLQSRIASFVDQVPLQPQVGKPKNIVPMLVGAVGLLILVIGLILYSQQAGQPATDAQTDIPTVGEIEVSEKSIAVMAFVNMSDGPENDFFSDGLSEEILNLLARIPGLKVIGRRSSFAFKGKNEDLRAVGQALGVETILEGSVRQSGDRVRIAAQLVAASDGALIWSDSYDRTLTDVFAIQDDVAAAIIDALQIHVSNAPTRGRPTESPQAYVLYLKARTLMNTHKSLGALNLLQQAILLDPDFAEAYELQAFCYWSESGGVFTGEEGFALMGKAAAAALAINPDLAFAQALYYLSEGDGPALLKGIGQLERVLRENPGDPWPSRLLIYVLLNAGYQRESLHYAQQYVDHDPLSAMANYSLGETLYSLGLTAEARAPLAFAFDLGEWFALWLVPAIHLLEGDDEEFISSTEDLLLFQGIDDTAWVRELVTGGRGQPDRQAYTDRRSEEILASFPDRPPLNWGTSLVDLYLILGSLDRYYEILLSPDPNQQGGADADIMVWRGTLFRRTGFTAHPRYLEAAEQIGIIHIWEQRGPPDFCKKVDNNWVCS
jgi:TolB-like protein